RRERGVKPWLSASILLLVVLLDAVFAGIPSLGPQTEAPPGLVETGASLGVLLLGAWLAGRIFASFGLPRITGYIALGVIVGPDILNIVTLEQSPYLRLVNDLAIVVIALTAGGEIKLDFLRRGARTISSITLVQSAVILGTVL